MNDYHPKNLLVTGGAGFIGSQYIHYLMEKHPQLKVVNLDCLTYAADEKNLRGLDSNPNYGFVNGDICDGDLVAKLLRDHNIDTIVHFAAESHVDRSISGPGEFIKTNIEGTYQLLEQARHHWLNDLKLDGSSCRFHHISTDEVYGSLEPNDPAFTEETPYRPNSPYSASKASSDHLVRAYHETYGLPMTLSNCSNNYGPHQHTEKLIPTIINACENQKTIPIYGDGSNVRDWLYVTDHCRAIHRVVTKGVLGNTYNVGGHGELSNLILAKQICQLFDERNPKAAPHDALIAFVTDRPGHDWRYAIDNTKIKSLGWKAATSLKQGLEATIQWYCD